MQKKEKASHAHILFCTFKRIFSWIDVSENALWQMEKGKDITRKTLTAFDKSNSFMVENGEKGMKKIWEKPWDAKEMD